MTKAKRPIERIGGWCARQAGATRDNTFGPLVDVYRVGNKIFAMVNRDTDEYVTLKANPEDALALRHQHDFVRPGYYMNKRHWITVDLVPGVPLEEIRELIEESYSLVFGSLTKSLQAQIVSDASGD